ncbi:MULTISPECIES: hypothetical protein [Pedobacter]|uniref:Uncharacterized protein n=1 Tax=Pedobacter suwonensis TaxID=332999 RepID=A0A1I0TTC3_9SPHI|nr:MULTISPECIES: hypothetical protein [Pedobacter]SFA54960.1 hypothetical protein SAMN04488511_11451 [Pedobacter suwonensis]
MFRKIRSNRDPGITVSAELYQEFRPYLTLIRRKTVRFLRAHPRLVFTLMVALIIFSLLFSFGLFSSDNKLDAKANNLHSQHGSGKNPQSIDDGLSKISSTGAKLRKTVEIKKQVDSVLERAELNNMDTLFLEAKLEELKRLR